MHPDGIKDVIANEICVVGDSCRNYSAERIYTVVEYYSHDKEEKILFKECVLRGERLVETGEEKWLVGEGAKTYLAIMRNLGFERRFRCEDK